MTYITKPNIPDSAPDVEFRDEARGDVFQYLKDCYEYLQSKGVDFEEYDLDEDEEAGGERWRVNDHISSIEREIENVDDENNQTEFNQVKQGVEDAAKGKVSKKDFSKYLEDNQTADEDIKELGELWSNPSIHRGGLLGSNVGVPIKISSLRDKEFKLCLVLDNQAWFTTQDVKDQWGDDWDDAPYEHNAGPPYEWDKSLSSKPYDIKKVYWESENARYSISELSKEACVEHINEGIYSWLYFHHGDLIETIDAGTTLEEFKKKVDVYALSK